MTDLLRCALPTESDSDRSETAARPFIADHILQGLAAARATPSHATPNLARWLRQTRRLGSRDRRIVGDAVLGVIRHEAFLLRAGARSDIELIAMWTAMIGGERFEHVQPASPAEDFSSALALPLPVAAEWLDRLGPDGAARFGQVQTQRAPLTLRANRLRCSREQLAERLLEEGHQTAPVPHTIDGLQILGRANVQALQSFKDGWFEVQDASSQRSVAALGDVDGVEVLDLCAGAGGKALALAAGGARVRATDTRSKALYELEKRAKRAGAEIAIEEPEPADIVFVDAPCSGLGRLWRTPAARWTYQPKMCVGLQAEILEAAADFVRPGGQLLYATCTTLQVENSHAPPEGWQIESTQTLWPHLDGSDGFHWQIWRRPAGS
jgi:16S rRNA (cytosine967-C5)-methyltransferase